ncbi:MAG: biotin synthase BioB [Gammaproteobacteria bacterium 39-13]|nr:biotin synthase BioB [Gammaproteobacteria bacterium]OJV88288.1 MAG: biotin synthase BioB [Gammaproteobacteria bacterium 39-13]
MSAYVIRHDWSYEEAYALYHQPFMDLVWQSQQIHRAVFTPNSIQVCTLQNIKVGGCPEDCHWCGQSIYHSTGVENEPLADLDEVIQSAKDAKANGASRYCLAASWRGPTDRNLNKVIEMVKAIKALGLETCITLGKLRPEQAQALKEAGLDYYNHNLETSENHFKKVSTTRSFSDRLTTLQYVREAGMKVCSGGILGMGETEKDRIELLITLANQPEHPQSVPINQLVRIEGTPLENEAPMDDLSFVRAVALARILMPKAYVRLSGGRRQMSKTMQTLCFMAGANSIHHGPKLLVTQNADMSEDKVLLQELGLTPEPAQLSTASSCSSHTIPLVVKA